MPPRTKSAILAADTGPPRRSARVARQLENEKATAAPDRKNNRGRPAPIQKKRQLRKARGRGKAARPRPAPTQRSTLSEKQPAKPRNKEIRQPNLSHQALEQLEAETQYSAFPQDLGTVIYVSCFFARRC